MKAALCLEQDQPLVVEEVTPLDPGPGDVIVRVTASGVCHSDLSVINGTLPAGRVVLGHEGTGVVEKVGADVTGLAGRRPRASARSSLRAACAGTACTTSRTCARRPTR